MFFIVKNNLLNDNIKNLGNVFFFIYIYFNEYKYICIIVFFL